jgi:hypothetical protein
MDEYEVCKVQDLTPSPFPEGKGRQAAPKRKGCLRSP